MLNKIKNRFNNKKGFTLVELIVVIVIILILAAVLVPNVTKYVSNAKEASLQSDAAAILTQVQADFTAYASGIKDTDIKKAEGAANPAYDSGKTVNGVTVTFKTTGATLPATANNAEVEYDGSEIKAFYYCRKAGETISWTQSGGWS